MIKISQTLYKKPKHKYLVKIVSFKTPTQARKSVTKLRKEFRKGKRAKKLRIARATQYASNRAKANLKRLKGKEYNEMKDVHSAYAGASKSFWNQYEKLYGKKKRKRIRKKSKSYKR